jgi:tRNA pseudouridine55 synthase
VVDSAGILNVNKPAGWTSHDVVARVRRLASQKRVGHAGTLDPMATGVLPVLLGRATRLADFIHSGQKTYVARVRLGIATETDDAEGAVVSESDVPSFDPSQVLSVLDGFVGNQQQTPPRYSAVKVEGRRAYAVARGGGAVVLAPRPITIFGLQLLDSSPTELTLDVVCSRGTYIRSLARDIAAALGTVGHLSALTRTRVGPFTLEDSLTVDALAARGIADSLLPASTAVPDAPSFNADRPQASALLNGRPVASVLRAHCVWVYDPDGCLICLASSDGTQLRPRIAL